MNWEALRVTHLQAFASAAEIHPLPRRKADLIRAIQAALHIPQMALQWDHLADVALDAAIQGRGLQVDQGADRAAKIVLLQLAGIGPAECLLPLLPQQPTAPQAPKVLLQRQLESEPIVTFIERAKVVLNQPSLPDDVRIQHLLNAAQPDLAATIIGKMAQANTTFQDLLTFLREQATVAPTAALAQFMLRKPSTGESILKVGKDLLALYLQFLSIDLATYNVNSRYIAPAIIARVLQLVPNQVRMQLQAKYDTDPQISLDNFLRYAESLLASASKTAIGQQRNQSSGTGHRQFCKLHGPCGHATQDCRNLRQQVSPHSRHPPTPAGRQQRTAAVEPEQTYPNEEPVMGYRVDPTPDH